jgi:hypothetical protein
MAKYTISKTIEARKLNPRTRIPTADPPVTIPYGAIVSDIQQDRDVANFGYLGEYYQCPYKLMQEVMQSAGAPKSAATEAAPEAAVEPAAAAAEAAAPAPEAKLRWEVVASDYGEVRRAAVPGGWLVAAGCCVTFLPDPEHGW